LFGIEGHLFSSASVGHVLPPNEDAVGATSEQHRAQAKSQMPTASDEHFPALASWSQVYLLLFGSLFEHVGQIPLEQVDRHLPEGTIEREEHEIFCARAVQFAVDEGEMSEQ